MAPQQAERDGPGAATSMIESVRESAGRLRVIDSMRARSAAARCLRMSSLRFFSCATVVNMSRDSHAHALAHSFTQLDRILEGYSEIIHPARCDACAQDAWKRGQGFWVVPARAAPIVSKVQQQAAVMRNNAHSQRALYGAVGHLVLLELGQLVRQGQLDQRLRDEVECGGHASDRMLKQFNCGMPLP
jgi:hypothetical protein